MLIDSHAHLNFNAFKSDADEVVERCLKNDVWVVNVGSQLETSQRALELAKRYPAGIYATVGLHPIHAPGVAVLARAKLDAEELAAQAETTEFNIEDYRKLALEGRLTGGSPKRRVVAVGEIGLDYYWRPKTKTRLEEFKERQKQVLLQQLNLAKELNLPVIFHCRSAHEDLLDILKIKEARGVLHCFTGSAGQARQYLDLGFYLGFTAIIFRQIPGVDWTEIIRSAPLNKILIETDSPYLTPPASGKERNEPLFVRYVAEEIARIKNISYEEVAQRTTENAKSLFKI